MREKPEGCDCCHFETSSLTHYKAQDTTIAGGGKVRQDDFWYCELCASTIASTYDRYPNQQPSNTEVMRTVCYVGNTILAALRRADSA